MSDLDSGRATAAAELAGKVAELDRKVAERTAELQVAVSNLHAQISQRAQAEARLRDSEQRYRRLIELSPDAVLVITETHVLYVNAAAVRLFGATDAAALLATSPEARLRRSLRTGAQRQRRSEEHTSELHSHLNLVCRLPL